MPDISMCAHSSCPSRKICFRHKASGTIPNFLQTYMGFAPNDSGKCDSFELAPGAKKPRGFAAMSPARRREIAAKGGSSVAPEKRSFSIVPGLAAEAGRLGGTNVPRSKRTFTLDPTLAAEAGRRGGKSKKDKIET
jgi:general stress protein YciG